MNYNEYKCNNCLKTWKLRMKKRETNECKECSNCRNKVFPTNRNYEIKQIKSRSARHVPIKYVQCDKKLAAKKETNTKQSEVEAENEENIVDEKTKRVFEMAKAIAKRQNL
jgi:DNA-directed RNA polymerase subunit RPC12/RpoP